MKPLVRILVGGWLSLMLVAINHAQENPGNTRIAFVSFRDKNLEIYVMDADGNNPQRLTQSNAPDSMPAWSPFVSQAVDPQGKSVVRWAQLKERVVFNVSVNPR